MWPLKYEWPSPWDIAYAADIAIASLPTYFIMTSVSPPA
jgi:hypothetical protein